MLDVLIPRVTIVNGTGAAPVSDELGIRDGRIVAVGDRLDERSSGRSSGVA